MTDIIYDIIMQSSILITGLPEESHMLILNLILSILGIFPRSLQIVDLSGKSSKYARFAPVTCMSSDILDMLRQLVDCIDNSGYHDTAKPTYIFINNLDYVINSFYGKDKTEFLKLLNIVINRGITANIHVIATVQKYSNFVMSGFSTRIYAGHTDRKTAQKYFGAISHELTNFDCSDSGQAMSTIDGTICKFNVPEIPESAIDDIIIMHSLECSADNALICPEIAPTVRPSHIRIKSRIKAAKPTETDLHPIQATAQQSDAVPDDTDKNIIVLFLSFIIDLISGVFNRISAVRTRSFMVKIPVTVAMIVLYILSAPVKILYCLAQSGFPGGFMVLCIVYMTVTTLLQCIR